MDKIQQNLMSNLDWDGNGTPLDVGCGSATLSARVAKTYEHVYVIKPFIIKNIGVFWGVK